MKVDILTLCDSVQEYNGRLIIVGTFNKIASNNFPLVIPEFAVVARVVLDDVDKAKQNYTISIKKIDDDRDVYIMPVTEIKADNSNLKGDGSLMNIFMKGRDVSIQEPGVYRVMLQCDDYCVHTDLYVEQRE